MPQLERRHFSFGTFFSDFIDSSDNFFLAHSTRKLAAKFGRAVGYIGIGDVW